MSADAQELVRQLTENPEVLDRMQHMISLLRANPLQSCGISNGAGRSKVDAAGSARDAQPRVRPPRTTFGADMDHDRQESTQPPRLRGHNATGRIASSPPASSLTQEAPSLRIADRVAVQRVARGHSAAAGSAASPMPTFATGGDYGTLQVANPASRSGPCTSSLLSELHEHCPGTAFDEERLAATAKLMEAQQRIVELERELQRTTKRVEQLTDVVQRQKDELQVAQDRHVLEIEETRHTYNAVLQRKDEVQEEALRQLIKSRQLLVSAAKYNAVVAARSIRPEQLAKENNTGPSDEEAGTKILAGAHTSYKATERGGHSGPALTQTPLNARHSSLMDYGTNTTAKYRGALKRERQYDVDNLGDDVGVATDLDDIGEVPHRSTDQQRLLTKRTASDTWGLPGSADQAVQGRRGAAATTKTETSPPAYMTTLTPAGKMSTALVDTRTQSRSARKRRTPRTPSLTNADRLAVSSAGSSARSQRRLPGTSSLKIDSPTPVVSTAWTAGRSLTNSRTPPPSASVYTVSEAVSKHHRLQQQQKSQQPPPTRPPLAQRAAGRLPPNPLTTAAAPPAVSNTLSGASSVASGGPTRSPSPVNPKRGALLSRRFIFTGLKDDEPQRLTSAIAAVGGDAAALVSDLDEPPPHSTTHIVLRGTPRSVKALCGVVSGKWLVSPEYIYNSQESGFWLDELEEGGLRIFPPPLRCQRFLLTIEHPSIRAKLAQVIEYGGGEVLPSGSDKRGTGTSNAVAQDVIVITSGDDLLRYATQDRV
ncbi:uncharacterized protein JKF63_07966 [Porcisia hertigi]|uniref:Kinetoplastid kinetochore protein 4 n=1 Tax=Porcisia hertigi TaxID=2761500 RepID=A0A836H7T6_9TRYP|nr:hypothetical protein JKF63_07966 [Porcisia hertigi]